MKENGTPYEIERAAREKLCEAKLQERKAQLTYCEVRIKANEKIGKATCIAAGSFLALSLSAIAVIGTLAYHSETQPKPKKETTTDLFEMDASKTKALEVPADNTPAVEPTQ